MRDDLIRVLSADEYVHVHGDYEDLFAEPLVSC